MLDSFCAVSKFHFFKIEGRMHSEYSIMFLVGILSNYLPRSFPLLPQEFFTVVCPALSLLRPLLRALKSHAHPPSALPSPVPTHLHPRPRSPTPTVRPLLVGRWEPPALRLRERGEGRKTKREREWKRLFVGNLDWKKKEPSSAPFCVSGFSPTPSSRFRRFRRVGWALLPPLLPLLLFLFLWFSFLFLFLLFLLRASKV